MTLQERSDASFFALVHNVLESSRDDGERRDNERRDFTCQQFIAPFRDGRLPSQAEFRRVLCRDLSSRGFSYHSSEPPDSEYLIVALGNAPFIFVSARVMRYAPAELAGEAVFVVGCKFIARVTGPEFGDRLGPRQGT